MATNLNRFLSNIRNNPSVSKLIQLTDKKFPSYALGAQTPLLNHYLPVDINSEGAPTNLFFNKQASETLDYIRRIAQKKSVHRLDNQKTDTPIDFVCYGYQDNVGDIVIIKIIIPALEKLKKDSQSTEEALEKLYNYVPSKALKTDMLANYFDFLRRIDLDYPNSIGKKPVALLGATKPIVTCPDHIENCPRFSEIAKSIVPGDVEFDHDFLTGVLTVSPYKIAQTPKGLAFRNGSLECVLTNYKINTNTKHATPQDISNISKCWNTNREGKLEELEISKSEQPSLGFQQYNTEERNL